MNCCFIDLGSFPHNEAINTGIQADQTGEYIFKLNFLGAIRHQKQTILEIGDDLIIPGVFNEEYSYELQIIKPDGTMVTQMNEEVECDKFIFRTFVAIKEECNGTTNCDTDLDNIDPYPPTYS